MARKILIAEDQPEVRRLLELTLSSLDAEFIATDSGEAALALVQEQLPALVILDVRLAGSLSGIGVCTAIKSSPDLQHIPVIVVTTGSQLSHQEIGRRAGADAYLTKPFSPADLLRVAQRLLG